MKNEPLRPELQAVLDELTSYHRERLYHHQASRERTHAADNQRRPISLARAVRSMAEPGGLHGTPEGELFEAVAKLSGRNYDPQRIFVPFGLFRRDLTVASASQAGYLVSTEVQEAVDILRPWSVTAKAGGTIETGLVGSQAVPKTTVKSTPYWLSNESSQATASTPTLAQVALAPKQVGVVVNFSRQLALQANAEAFVRRELLRTLGTAIDQAVLNGSGASGQPLGLLNTTGVQTQSGTTLNAGCFTMKQTCAVANVNDEGITFLSTPAIRQLLETRERATGGGRFVWQDDKVADRRAYVSTDVPTATMIAGDWSNVYLGIWGAGFVVEINPYDPTNFKAGIIQARIIVSCDVAVLQPAGFVVASSIT